MQVYFQGFGSTRALSGYSLQVAEKSSVAQVKTALIKATQDQEKYTGLDEILVATAFASETHVFDENDIISEDTIINLLPPVCGG